MSEERRKLWLYLYPDEPHQKAAIDAIETVPLRQRPDFFRDCLVAGVALSTLDKRLPALLALLLDGQRDALTLQRTLSLVLPEMTTDNHGTTLQAVAWQKRVRDELAAGNPWTAWIAIAEKEYRQRTSQPENNVEVRALLAPVEPASAKPMPEPLQEAKPEQKAASETLSNAKKMFGDK